MDDVSEPGEIEIVRFESSGETTVSEPIVLTPTFEAADFAELEERFHNVPERTEAWRAAGLWALGVLKQVLGEQWPGKTSLGRDGNAWVVADLCGAHSHTRHYARLLELALWLDGLASAPGMARVRQALRDDRTPGRWEHTRLQLEIAALAQARSASVSFEGAGRTGRDSWPADVEAVIGERTVALETFAILPSDAWLAKVERTDAIQARLHRLEHRHQVACNVDFGGESLDGGDSLERFFTQIEYGATIVAAGAEHHTAREGRAVAHIARAIPSGFNGPPIQIESAWERVAARLGEKQTQVGRREDTVWLRVDLLEGMWQFSHWSQAPLRVKLDLIAPQIEAALGGSEAHVAGVVVSSGSAWAQGHFEPEDAATAGGRRALRRLIAPIRVRETLVIPLGAGAEEDAVWLARLYEDEPSWLPSALQRSELPALAEMFPADQEMPIIAFSPAQRWKRL
jgi:hypothetical protein